MSYVVDGNQVVVIATDLHKGRFPRGSALMSGLPPLQIMDTVAEIIGRVGDASDERQSVWRSPAYSDTHQTCRFESCLCPTNEAGRGGRH